MALIPFQIVSKEDHWLRDRFFAGLLFFVLQLMVIRFLQVYHRHWWAKLPLVKQGSIPPCIVGLIHHSVVLPIAMLAIYKSYTEGHLLAEADVYILSLFSFGYLSE